MSPEEFQQGIKEEHGEVMSLGEAELHVSCATTAVDLVQSSPSSRAQATDRGLIESVAGRVMPTAHGAEELARMGMPLELLGFRFDDVPKLKEAIAIVKRLLEREPDLTDEELKDRTHKELNATGGKT